MKKEELIEPVELIGIDRRTGGRVYKCGQGLTWWEDSNGNVHREDNCDI